MIWCDISSFLHNQLISKTLLHSKYQILTSLNCSIDRCINKKYKFINMYIVHWLSDINTYTQLKHSSSNLRWCSTYVCFIFNFVLLLERTSLLWKSFLPCFVLYTKLYFRNHYFLSHFVFTYLPFTFHFLSFPLISWKLFLFCFVICLQGY